MDKTQKIDPNKTIATGAMDNRTMAMGAPPVAGDPNRTTAWAPAEPITVTVTPSRTATMANGPAREQFLVDISASDTPGLPGVAVSGPRTPLNLCLVLDRSGSMEGAPLDYAKQAVSHVVDLLSPNDVLSIVVFDETVDVLMPPQRVTNKQAIKDGVAQIQPGYTTNISDAMTLAAQQLAANEDKSRVTRMVFLTDGEPTAGIKEHHPLVQHSGDIKSRGVTCTFLGFGAEYNEELLAAMAKKTGGNYYYITQPQLIPEVFRTELEKLITVAAMNLRLDVRLSRWVSLRGGTGLAASMDDNEFTLELADLERGASLQQVFDFDFDNHPLGHYVVATGKLSYEDTTGGGATKTVPLDLVMEFTADAARYSVAPNPIVANAHEISAASRVVEKTIMGLKTMQITTAQAMAELEKTQALLLADGRTADAQEVTLAMNALKSGDVGGAEKTLMGTMLHIDQGKK
ncbi:MAG TPA: VWA domain-containing protein [Fimbriimonadaceae bacterium]|nr:VWA domain-containing protein [Fimbriimonadaceae bacterium]